MIRTVGKMQIEGTDEWLVIFDTGLAPLHVDLITEIAEEDGIVRMSFAAISTNGDGIPKADVVARLRMKTDVAWGVCRSLRALEG